MELFAVILLGIAVVLAGIFMWMEIGITNDRLRWLEERLTKLEKDAVKVTFTPFTTGDEKRISKPLVEGEVKSTSKGDTGTTQSPPPKTPPVLGEWQIKNGNPYKYKRKPKTVKEWEDEIDLGGHE